MQMKLDFLFNRHDPGTSWRGRKEPRLGEPGGRDSTKPPEQAADAAGDTFALLPHSLRRAGRQMSPRQLAEWAHDMYIGGALNWEEYRLAGFPAELHPQYNVTIGALTGQLAAPDRPRDMVREWEDRLAFFNRHNSAVGPQLGRTEKILTLLRKQSAPQPKRARPF
jgi:hypothetical protein